MEKQEWSDKLNELAAVAQALQLLATNVHDLKEKLTPRRPEWHGRSDARRMALGNIYRPCLTNPILLFNLMVKLGNENELETFARLTGLEMDTKNRENAFWDIAFFVLTNTLLIFQFQVENLFQNLYRELGGAEERSFTRLSEKLLGAVGFDDIPEKMKRLRSLAYLRNSLHNNGVHKGADFAMGIKSTLQSGNVTIDVEANYSFVRNQKVTCCGPMHIFCLLHGVTDIVNDVLTHEKITSIIGPIMDVFAWSDDRPGMTRCASSV